MIFTDEEFVRLWQQSSGPQEVAERLGVNPHEASAYATRLRVLGVPLRSFARPRRLRDIEALKRIALEAGSERVKRI